MQGRTIQGVSLLFDDGLPVCAPLEVNCLGTTKRVCRCDTRRKAGASERAPRRMDILWAVFVLRESVCCSCGETGKEALL
jgi:hypothetical protein